MRSLFVFCFLAILGGLVGLAGIGYGSYWVLEKYRVGKDAESAAYAALKKEVGKIPKKGSLFVVDFSHPSQSKRFRFIDLATQEVVFDSRVSHGLNSGGIMAKHFSNKVNSYQSSLGLFEVAERYEGKHGWSMRLDGCSPAQNSRARERGIILHRGDYVDYGAMLQNWNEGFRLGRSLGCFVLTPQRYEELEAKIQRPAYIYAHR